MSTHSKMFPKGDMGAGKQGPFWADIGSSMVLKVENPDGCVYSSDDLGAYAQGAGGPNQHEGAMTRESNLGMRGGRQGKKPVS